MPYLVHGRAPTGMTLGERMAYYKVPAVSIAMVRNGRIAWVRAYGVMRTGGPPVNPETPFEAGSISKPVLVVGLLTLVQTGRLDLDTDVNRYLSSWKIPDNAYTQKRKVTIRDLLAHEAGVTNPGADTPNGQPAPTLLQVLNGDPPATNPPITVDSTPGAAWAYSNGGYDVLAQLLEDVTGETFPSFMEQAVFGPLQMTRSTYDRPGPGQFPLKYAMPYDENGNMYANGPYTAPLGDGGLWSTPTDLARLAIAVQQAWSGKSHFLSAPMARQMLTPVVQENPLLYPGSHESQGLGFRLAECAGPPVFGHSGHNEGYECEVEAFCVGDGVVVMTNSDNGGRLCAEVIQTIAHTCGWPCFQPKERDITALDATNYCGYEGSYQAGPYTVVKIVRDRNRLLCYLNSTYCVELSPENARDWLSDDGEAFHFQLDRSGRARRLIYPWNDVATAADRVDDTTAAAVVSRAEGKFKSQAPDPGTEPALRALLKGLQTGKLDYRLMTPGWASFFRENLRSLRPVFNAYGPLRSVTFLRVSGGYDDSYRADFENETCVFRIGLTADGKIYRLQQRPSVSNP
jgi:CubicO group peptidase (beta-lactamase class C family)